MAQRPGTDEGEVLTYVRAPVPLIFPEEAEAPVSRRHLELRTVLFHLLFDELSEHATIGSDQFVYWDAGDPRACAAPDAFVRLGTRDASFGSWKVWERGAPDVAVEIVSDSDAPEASWDDKLDSYRHMGVRQVVRFDARARPPSLRVWDRVDGDLVERLVEKNQASTPLGLSFVVAAADGLDPALRVARPDGTLVPTRLEARRAEEQARRTETEGREAAERRIAELEAELARLRRG